MFAPRNRLFVSYIITPFFLLLLLLFCLTVFVSQFRTFLWYSYTKIQLPLSPPQPTVFCVSLHSSLLFLFPEEFYFIFMSCIACIYYHCLFIWLGYMWFFFYLFFATLSFPFTFSIHLSIWLQFNILSYSSSSSPSTYFLFFFPSPFLLDWNHGEPSLNWWNPPWNASSYRKERSGPHVHCRSGVYGPVNDHRKALDVQTLEDRTFDFALVRLSRDAIGAGFLCLLPVTWYVQCRQWSGRWWSSWCRRC